MHRSNAIALGGALATAISFGPARMGFGLFLPQFREEFTISTQQASFIASAGFAGFFVALLLASLLVARWGPKCAVVAGAASATLGMAMISVSQSPLFLAAGVVVASASAGFCWSPFNNVARRGVAPTYRNRALAIISTGTTGGIALAGLTALWVASADQGWRTAWVLFALAALVAALANLRILKHLPAPPVDDPRDEDTSLKQLLHKRGMPLYAIALSFGMTNGIYLSFAVTEVENAGGLSGIQASLSGPVLYVSFGLAGLLGLFTAELKQRLGMALLIAGIFTASMASLALIGLVPATWGGLIASAALQGVCVMMLSAIYSFWSAALFPALATLGFTAVLIVFAFGNIVGPALAGTLDALIGMNGVFLLAAVVSLATAIGFFIYHLTSHASLD